MGRYIDADYVNAFPIRIDHYDEEHGNRHFVLGIESVMEYIEEAPSIDIVRCKECRWGEVVRNHSIGFCENQCGVRSAITESSYCSYGERREP